MAHATTNTQQVKNARAIFAQLDYLFSGRDNPISRLRTVTETEERSHRKTWSGRPAGMSVPAAAEVLALSWLGKFFTEQVPLPGIEALLTSTQTYCLAGAIVAKHGDKLAAVFTDEVAAECAALDYAALMA